MVVKIIITLDNLENSRFIDEKKLCKKNNCHSHSVVGILGNPMIVIGDFISLRS